MRFFLLHIPKHDFWGSRIISTQDSKREMASAFNFLRESSIEHPLCNTISTTSIMMEIYEIKDVCFTCMTENRWHLLAEDDFEELHAYINDNNPILTFNILRPFIFSFGQLRALIDNYQ